MTDPGDYRLKRCGECGGSGLDGDPESEELDCGACGGTGLRPL